MTQQYELPAHLKNRQRQRRLTEGALAGIGGSLPPHISIQGNNFTLIDAAGNEAADAGATIECVIVDRSDVICKMYYGGKEFTPGSNDPPVCWSTNGVAPSRDAISPQNTDCASCPHNERGSAVSKISGAAIKACRDEKHLALWLPAYPDMMFRLVVTPGSFKNWSQFVKPFEGQPVDLNDVQVTIGFQPKTNGVLVFQATNYVTPEQAAICDKALAEKATDVLVGRNDVPWSGYVRAIAEQHRPLIPTSTGSASSGKITLANAPPVAFPSPPIQTATSAPQEPQQRRKRRTAAEMAAAREGGQLQGNGPVQQAPFRPASPPVGGAASPAGAPPFGIGQGSAPNPEVAGMLNSIFKK